MQALLSPANDMDSAFMLLSMPDTYSGRETCLYAVYFFYYTPLLFSYNGPTSPFLFLHPLLFFLHPLLFSYTPLFFSYHPLSFSYMSYLVKTAAILPTKKVGPAFHRSVHY